MRNMFTKVAAAAAILAGASTGANAFVVMTLTDVNVTDSTFVTLTCSTLNAATTAACAGAGFFVAGGGNIVTFGTSVGSGTIGDYTIVTTTGSSNSPGTPLVATTNRSQTEATRNNSLDGDVHRLLVDFRAFDYSDPNGLFKTLSGSAGITANTGSFAALDSVTTFFSVDKDNLLAATTSVQCTLTPATNPLNESCGLGPVPWTDNGGLFSMSSIQQFDIAIGTTMNSTANSAVRNVPEPMTTALIAVALLGVGLATRRGAKKA